jgi:hypothetical protein
MMIRWALPLGAGVVVALFLWLSIEDAKHWRGKAAEYAVLIEERDRLLETSENRRTRELALFEEALSAAEARTDRVAHERNEARDRASDRARDLQIAKEANDALLDLLDTVADDWLRYNCDAARAEGINPGGRCRDPGMPGDPALLQPEERDG